MLCSECSRPVTPVVAVDIDGTLGDYHRHFLNFAQGYMQMIPQHSRHYDGKGSFKAWFCEAFFTNERTWQDIKLAYRQGGMKRSMPIFPGAVGLCATVRNMGAELWLTTTRPFLRLDNIDPDTRFWLESYSIEYDGLLYDENKYHRLAELVDKERVVAVVDDLPEMVEQAREAFGWRVPIMARNDFNGGIAGDILNLNEITKEVGNRISVWKESHA